ncbi:MAG: four helix bundle protein [Marinobacterium sp.]|nr:four helix bundle protein [Marinobacterium sp.]
MELQSYEKTPIYRHARDLLRDAHRITASMSKNYKYSLGKRITEYAQLLVESVFLAYEERDDPAVKLAYIGEIKAATHRLMISYRVADDLQQIPRKDYGAQTEVLVGIIKQTRGWQRSAPAVPAPDHLTATWASCVTAPATTCADSCVGRRQYRRCGRMMRSSQR